MMDKRNNLKAFEKYLTDRNIAIFLFVVALSLRIMFVNDGIPHFDSIADANKAKDTFDTTKFNYSYGYGAPGIIFMLTIGYALDHWITGATNAEFAYFFITLVTAALSISMLYLVIKKITNNKTMGIMSALFFCVTPIYLSITTYPKTHAPAIFFALLAGYFLIKARDEKEKRLKYIIISGLLFSFSISIRVFNFLYILPFFVLYLKPKAVNNKKIFLSVDKELINKKNVFCFVFSLFIVLFLLFVPYLIDRGAGAIATNIAGEQKTVAWQGLFSDRIPSSIQALYVSVTWLGVIAIILGLLYFFKKDRMVLAAFLLWFLSFFLWYGNLRGNEPRFLSDALIALIIFMAAGCYVIYQNSKLFGIIFAAALIVMMFITIYPIIEYRHNYSGQKEFALWVASVTEPSSILITTDEGFFYQFYTGRPFIGHYYSGTDDEIANFIEIMHNYLQKGVPVYMSEAGIGYDPDGRFGKALMDNFDIYVVGSKTNEAYGQNTLQFQLYEEKLLRIEEKKQ